MFQNQVSLPQSQKPDVVVYVKGKVRVCARYVYVGAEVYLHSFITSALDGGECQASLYRRRKSHETEGVQIPSGLLREEKIS